MSGSSDHPQQSLVVPDGYLDDVRRAAVIAVDTDTSGLRAMQIESESGRGAVEDLRSHEVALQRSMRLLDALLAAEGRVELRAAHDRLSDPLIRLLEDFVRTLNARLTDVVQYGPMEMSDVLNVAERLGWAAREAIRIEPSLALAR